MNPAATQDELEGEGPHNRAPTAAATDIFFPSLIRLLFSISSTMAAAAVVSLIGYTTWVCDYSLRLLQTSRHLVNQGGCLDRSRWKGSGSSTTISRAALSIRNTRVMITIPPKRNHHHAEIHHSDQNIEDLPWIVSRAFPTQCKKMPDRWGETWKPTTKRLTGVYGAEGHATNASSLGIAVAYTAPVRHGCLKVVENNYCASKRASKEVMVYRMRISIEVVQTPDFEYGMRIGIKKAPREILGGLGKKGRGGAMA
ncbi:hypothetical protein RJ640_012512 [Escallonia rubra]|uniref:Uncharacterized protein n=1 Tax=Escallonia rubra TaxID=112253 RepID=A0AA88UGC1_9ASTE|nr:hypothetical protein RJ640_012512 [Escallonia rubra]